MGTLPDESCLPALRRCLSWAYKLLGDAEDWLRSDWRPGTAPGTDQAAALRDARAAIREAKEALNKAAG
jgi:hypothetical protein